MSLLILTATVLLSVSTSGLNLTRLIGMYINTCGTQGLCYDWPGFRKPPGNPVTARCPECSCEEECFRLENCCPDKFFLERKLRTPRFPIYDMLPMSHGSKHVKLPRYPVIDSCPEFSEQSSISLCRTPPVGVNNRNFVTSLVSNYTYFNIHCASCHGETEQDLLKWNIAINQVDGIINFIESDEAILNMAEAHWRTIIFSPPKSLTSIAFPVWFYDESGSQGCLNDDDLRAACESSYVNEYRGSQNLFCYWCRFKMHLKSDQPIATCSSPHSELNDVCTAYPVSELAYPYKNFYCFSCNIPYSFVSNVKERTPYGSRRAPMNKGMRYTFLDLSTVVKELLDDHAFAFTENVYNDLSLVKVLLTTLSSNDRPGNKLTSFSLDKFRPLLNTMAAVYPNRICHRNILSSEFQNMSRQDCDCSPICLFRNSCACCIDTALAYNVECMSSARVGFSSFAEPFQVIKSCFKETKKTEYIQLEENVKNLCESTDLKNFDLPVLSNNITYKNVFCLLCNTDFTITNTSLTTVPYKILNTRIYCRNDMHFNFFVNFSQILAEAFKMQCDVLYEVQNLVLCSPGTPQNHYTSTCDVTTDDSDQAAQWACENASPQSFSPIGKYKNEFCLMCNSHALNISGDGLICNDSASNHLRYKNACMSLPDASYHPAVHPYRNAFCLLCQDKAQASPPSSPEECPPVLLGMSIPWNMNSIRNLFVPLVTLEASVFETKSQVGLQI